MHPGISVVHVNRTLQELRKRRLIKWKSPDDDALEF
jgi:hypothetical protein